MTNNELRNMDRDELNKALAEAWHQVEIALQRHEFLLKENNRRDEFLLKENNRRIWG